MKYGFLLFATAILLFGLPAAAGTENVVGDFSTAPPGQAPPDIAPLQAPFPMPPLQRPAFPERTFPIMEYGAVGDGATKNTEAFRNAIVACNKAGGGQVLVPPGKWLTGAIHLQSNVNLHLQEGAEIHFSDDPGDYLPVVFTRWAGIEAMNYSPLIYANGCSNIAITGKGALYGHGDAWWDWCTRLDEKNKVAPALMDMAARGVPPEERVFGRSDLGLRPQFINPVRCKNVLLEGFTIRAPGPFWTIHFVYCDGVIARDLAIHTQGGPNLDGINLDSTRNALVEYCTFDTDDDAVAVKSGMNEDGRRVGMPSENILIRHCLSKGPRWGSISIGSDMSGGVRNVCVEDITLDGTLLGLYIKSNPGRGGSVEDIYYRRIRMHDIQGEAIRVQSDYAAWGAATGQTHYPLFRNIHFTDITCDGAGTAALVQGMAEKALEDLYFERITFDRATPGMQFGHVRGLILKEVTCNSADKSPVRFEHCTEVSHLGADVEVDQVASGMPQGLQGYDPSGLIRFKTPAEAEAKRTELIRFIWPGGLPVDSMPTAETGIGPEVFSRDLDGLDAALAASVDRLDADIAPYDFHGISYLIHPRAHPENNHKLVIVNSGHRTDGPFSYGVNDAINRFLQEGLTVLVSDMPLVGFNRDNTLLPPTGSVEVTLEKRGSAAHKEMFSKLLDRDRHVSLHSLASVPALPGGEIFRLFLEPMIQGTNYFLAANPEGAEVAYVGLSGGGWTGHMLAALDIRIRLSFPIAGAMPLYARDFSPGSWGDDEQFYPPLYEETDTNGDGITDTAAGVASWLEIFALGGLGNGRRQVQILNLYDECCFSGYAYKSYAGFVADTVRRLGAGRWEFHSDATHRKHVISQPILDNVIVPGLLDLNP